MISRFAVVYPLPRDQLGHLVDDVATAGDLIYITRRGHLMAALVPVWAIGQLLELAASRGHRGIDSPR